MNKIVLLFLALYGSALGQSSTLTINTATGQVNVPSGSAVPNFTALKVGSVTITAINYGTGVATFLATPSSANLRSALTDETGTGAAVFASSPTLTTPALGTPSAAVLTNATGLPLTTGVTGVLPQANGGTGVADPLFLNVRTVMLTGASANTAGGGTGNLSYGMSSSGPGGSPLTASDVAEYAVLGFTGSSSGAGVGSFDIPTEIAWAGSMTYIPANANYGIFGGSWSGGATLNQAGYGVRVIDKDTLQLVVYVSGVAHTQNVTVTGFLDNNTGAANRQCIVLKWNGSNTLDLYAAFAAPGAAMAAPTLRGSITQAASGNTFSTHLRWGFYSTGTSTFTNAPGITTFNLRVREN